MKGQEAYLLNYFNGNPIHVIILMKDFMFFNLWSIPMLYKHMESKFYMIYFK